MSNVIYKGSSTTANTDRNASPQIWADCPRDSIRAGTVDGFYIDDDFAHGGLITSPTTEAALVGVNYNGFGSSGAAHTFGTGLGGELVMTEATDNEAIYTLTKTHPFQISSLLGTLWYEARVKISNVALDTMGFICGFWDDVATSVVVPLSTADPPIMATTGNFVGFRVPEEDTGVVQTCYDADDAGQTVDAEVVVQAAVHTMVADTYVKLGMKFDPAAGKLRYYINGVEQTSTVTVPNATGTTFPADAKLGLLAGHRNGDATPNSGITTIDWWKCYQVSV